MVQTVVKMPSAICFTKTSAAVSLSSPLVNE